MVHKVCLVVVVFSAAKANPEKVIRFFAFIQNLKAKALGIKHFLDNAFGNPCFLWIRLGSYPDIDYS